MAAALQPPARPARGTRLASTKLEETFANLSDDQKYEALLLGAERCQKRLHLVRHLEQVARCRV